MSVAVPAARAEEARALMIELFPEGFEEVEAPAGLELAAYTSSAGERRLRRAFGPVTASEVSADWEGRWREFHRPVRVGPLWIGPPWAEPPAGAVAVVVEPGRAFGTGGHATTRLCLELLLELPRGSLLDVGCGSGVLAVAGARLGFAPVSAVDVDPAAVDATRRNAAANAVTVDVRLADALAEQLPAAAVAVANLALDAVVALAPLLLCDRLVTSGYLRRDRPSLAGFRAVRRRVGGEWAADLHVRE